MRTSSVVRRAVLVMSVLPFACGGGPELADGPLAVVPPDAPCSVGPGKQSVAPDFSGELRSDGRRVYFSQKRDNRFAPLRITCSDGSVESILAGDHSVQEIAVDPKGAYVFSTRNDGTPADPQWIETFTAVVDGETPRALLPDSHTMDAPLDLGVTGDVLVWHERPWTWPDEPEKITQMPTTGGAVHAMPVEKGFYLANAVLGRTDLFLVVADHRNDLARDINGERRLSLNPPLSLQRMSLERSDISTIADGDWLGRYDSVSLALDETWLYVGTKSALVRMKPDGSERETLASTPASSLTVDGHAVYYLTGNSIMKWDKATRTSSEAVSGIEHALSLVLCGGNIYWANQTKPAQVPIPAVYELATACK